MKFASHRRPTWLHYGLALFLTVSMLLIQLGISLGRPGQPTLGIFLIAVIFSAYAGGLGPGLLSAILGVLTAKYFLLAPIHHLRVSGRIDFLRLATLLVLGVLVSIMSEMMHRSKEQLARDIAGRLRIEYRLREYEKAVEGLEEMIVVVDRDYRYLIANRAYLKYRHMDRQQVIGHRLSEVIRQDVFDQVIKPKLDECFEGKTVHFELRYDYPHWGERDLFISHFPIEGPSGVDRAACILQDITERKQADAVIREERNRAQRYLDIAEVILLALDLEGRISLINRKGCALLGWDESELLGRDWADTCLPVEIRPAIRTAFHKLIGGDLRYIENAVLTRSGEERMIGWHNSQLRDAEGRVIGTLSSGEDITDRKLAEEKLERLSGEILRLQDEERRSIARDLHDSTGQNLAALRSVLALLNRSIPEASDAAHQLIAESRELADQVIQEIRTASYILHPPLLDEAGLEVAIQLYLEGFSKRSGIRVELEVSPSFERMERNVELAMFRVIQESLTNIQRHSGSPQAKIRLDRAGPEVILEVSDTGRGISAGRDKSKAGVGISSMQERVKQIGGRVVIDSGSHGTTVRVTLPTAIGNREARSKSA